MRKAILAGAAAVALVGAPALAQTTTTADDAAMMNAAPVEDDNDFPWGLLGLLGLAGLLGRRKTEHHEVRRNP